MSDATAPDASAPAPQPVGVTPRAIGQPVQAPTPETARLYAADWRDFLVWCRTARATSLPASPATLGAYLLAIAPSLSRGALGRRRAAIAAMHRQQGLSVPALDNAARAAVRRAARSILPRRSESAFSPASLRQVAARCPRDLAGLRDRALLLLAAATGSRASRQRNEPAAMDCHASADRDVARAILLHVDAEHVRFTDAGVTLQLKTRPDEAEPSRKLVLPRASQGAPSCPVQALEDWLRLSDTVFGPAFRKIDRWGNIEHARLGADAWRRILARRCAAHPPRRPTSAGRT